MIIHREVKVATKVSELFTDLNSRNQVMVQYQPGQILNRRSRSFLYSKSGTFINSDDHVCPCAQPRKMVQQISVLVLKTYYDRRIVSKLKPMNGGE